MLENMAGTVGMAMQADRLAQASKNLRLAEAKQGRRSAADGGYRRARAALGALASRIAPPGAATGGHAGATAR